MNGSGERSRRDFRSHFLANASAWKQWLEFGLMRARQDEDYKAITAHEAELNMICIMVESAKAWLDETGTEESTLAVLTRRFAQGDMNYVRLEENGLGMVGHIELTPEEYNLLRPLMLPDSRGGGRCQ